MMDIALARCGMIACCTLTLPVKKRLIDGIILIHGGWRIVLIGFVQGYEQHIQLLLGEPLHTLTYGRRLHEIKCHQKLISGISTMKVDRTRKAKIQHFIQYINVVVAILHQLQHLTAQNLAL